MKYATGMTALITILTGLIIALVLAQAFDKLDHRMEAVETSMQLMEEKMDVLSVMVFYPEKDKGE